MDEFFPGGMTADCLPDWHEAAVKALDFPLGWNAAATDPVAWKRKGRDAFRSLLIEDATPVDPAPRLGSSERRDGYSVHDVTFCPGRFRRVSAYLAVPDGDGPFPAAILLHDHGGYFDLGRGKMILPFRDDPDRLAAESWAEGNYGSRSVGDELAMRGWVAFCADALGWGSRNCHGYANQQAIASNLFNLGSSWAGLIAVEDMAAAAFLASLPYVDPGRVACLGHSMGSVRSWQLSALSDTVSAAVGSCSFGTIAGLMAPGGNRTRGQSAFSMTHPGLSRLMDFPDVAALAAPKPLYLINGRDDRLFPAACVQAAFDKTRAVYEAFGHGERFRGEWVPGGHEFSAAAQDAAFDWMESSLPPLKPPES